MLVACIASAAAVQAPVNLASAVAGTDVTLMWSSSSTEPVLGYVLEAGSAPGLSDLASFDTGTSASSYTARRVAAGTYFVRVRARDASGVSGPSNEVMVVVTGATCASAPGPPINLTSAANGSTVTLQWTAPSGGCAPTSYTIEVGSSPGASNLASVPTGNTSTTFSTSGVSNGTYYIRVRAMNAFGAGAASNESTLVVDGTTPTGFTVDLPIAAADTANNAYGIWPFGVHGGGHAADGHPGWDVEFRPGANVLVAADGTVSSAFLLEDNRYSVRIQHSVGGASYATDYTNVAALGPGIANGARVTRGQVLGSAGVQSQFIGSRMVTWGMTHFQVNDFTRSEGLTNPSAVSPEPYLSPSSRVLFESIWRTSAYTSEWCEPFFTNSRLATFPVTRVWTRQSGTLPAIVVISCLSATTNQMTYALKNADGSQIEAGTFSVDAAKRPLTVVDFTPSAGSARLGVWDIVSDTLQLNLAGAGATRPSSLSGATTYITR